MEVKTGLLKQCVLLESYKILLTLAKFTLNLIFSVLGVLK